jgi:hypothetical protein
VCVCVCVCVCVSWQIYLYEFLHFFSNHIFFLEQHCRRTEFANRLQARKLLPPLDAGEVTVFVFNPSHFSHFSPSYFFWGVLFFF